MSDSRKIRQAEGLLRKIPTEGETVLPKTGEKNILITSALPYCNNVPHLGNIIGSTLSADVFSRYARTRNWNTLYVCGTDEYGTATETQARKEKISPKELCDKYHALHAETYRWFEIAFDYFGRTSSPLHTEVTQSIYLHLHNNNKLVKQTEMQTYCEGCQRFLADRFVTGICPNCGYDDARGDQCDKCSRTFDSAVVLIAPRCQVDASHTVVPKPTSHMYVKLDEIQPLTEEWIKKAYKAGKWSSNSVINPEGEIIDSRLKGGLRPSPVTRDLTWGVPVPHTGKDNEDMEKKVLYVWFDAPIGYPSITANYTPDWEKWWFNPDQVKLYQFMGKDNVYFHTVFFPSILIGDGRPWTMLHHISTTEYLNYEGGKFSKSRNLGVFGPAAKETSVPPSVWRYYLLQSRPENADSMFSWTDFIAANNNVLLANFGNFVNRALKFVQTKFNGVIPDGGDEPGPLPIDDVDKEFVTEVNNLLQTYVEYGDAVKIRSGLQTIMSISARGNLYLQHAGLGNLLLAENPKRCAQVISRAVNLIYMLSAAVFPYMPSTSESILRQLNAPPRTIGTTLSHDILAGHAIGTPEHLFSKIEEKKAEEWKARFGTSEQIQAPAGEIANGTAGGKPISKKQAEKARKQAEKEQAAARAKDAKPKSDKVVELEGKVKMQGDAVRKLKGEKASAEEIQEAVAALNRLKIDLKAAEAEP